MKSVIKSNALKFISALDHIRWNETKENYSELNLYKTDISDEDKILSHWITYLLYGINFIYQISTNLSTNMI